MQYAVVCCAVLCSAGYGGCDRGSCRDRPKHTCGQERRRAQGLVQQWACEPRHPGQGLQLQAHQLRALRGGLADEHFLAAAVGKAQFAVAVTTSAVLFVLLSLLNSQCSCAEKCVTSTFKGSPLQQQLCRYRGCTDYKHACNASIPTAFVCVCRHMSFSEHVCVMLTMYS
jgi:hypothetical protein